MTRFVLRSSCLLVLRCPANAPPAVRRHPSQLRASPDRQFALAQAVLQFPPRRQNLDGTPLRTHASCWLSRLPLPTALFRILSPETQRPASSMTVNLGVRHSLD